MKNLLFALFFLTTTYSEEFQSLEGNESKEFINQVKNIGSYNVQFTTLPTDRQVNNVQLSLGIYFYKLKAGEFVETKKMLLVK